MVTVAMTPNEHHQHHLSPPAAATGGQPSPASSTGTQHHCRSPMLVGENMQHKLQF